MDKPLSTHTPDAIVVVNAAGRAVDCNNVFAKYCGAPAGELVGQQLAQCAPELAAALNTSEQPVIAIAEQTFALDVQPFTAGAASGDMIIRLRAAQLGEVA